MSNSYFTNIINDIHSILMPVVCFGCNAHLIRGENYLCTVCRNHLPLTEFTFEKENAVDRIFYGRIFIKKASSFLYFYKNSIVQKLIHHLKYKNQEKIGIFLGDWYGQLLRENGHLHGLDMIVPVPLHKKKLKQRGYNQVAEFAKRLAFHLNADYIEHVLVKNANTKTQTKKTRIGRWQDNKSLYSVADPSFFKNKTVLLVDDIITSGATMEMCAKALEQSEGITIYIASMALAR